MTDEEIYESMAKDPEAYTRPEKNLHPDILAALELVSDELRHAAAKGFDAKQEQP